MANIVCPNCGYTQEASAKCRKCSTLFAYHPQSGAHSSPPPRAAASPGEVSSPGLFRRVYRVVRWVTLAILLLFVILILRQSPPPQVRTDPQAVARVKSKLTELQSAVGAGQPYQLRLDEAEINAYLSTNLALKRESDGTTGALASASAGAEPSVEEVQSSVRDVKITMLDDRDRKSTRLNSSHIQKSRMPSSA